MKTHAANLANALRVAFTHSPSRPQRIPILAAGPTAVPTRPLPPRFGARGHRITGLAGLFVTLLGAATGFAQESHRLEVRHAVEVEFEAERGHTYRLQRSTNMVDWTNVDDGVYGHGRREDRLYSATKDDRGPRDFYRLVVVEAPTNGYAPWTLAGWTLNLDDQVGGDPMQFLTETNGVDGGVAPDSFSYVYTKVGTNEAKAEITYAPDRYDVLSLTFATPGLGTWVRDEFRKGRLKDRDVGSFRVSGMPGGTNNPPDGGGTNPPVVVPTSIPGALTGLAYVFQSGESPDTLEFSTASSGIEFNDDSSGSDRSTFTYTYSLDTTNAATLVVTFKPDRWDEYALTFASGAQGSFVRREFKNGVLDDTDLGAFSATGVSTGGSGGGTNNPPAGPIPSGPSLAGLTYTLNDDDLTAHHRPVFLTDTAGVDQDDSGPSNFTYTYTVTSASSAQFVLRFDVDKWHEYDLTYLNNSNSGTYVRRRFDKSLLKDTSTGTFIGAPTAP